MADKIVDVPGVGAVAFPDTMDDAAISSVLVQQYGGGKGNKANLGSSGSSISPPPGTPTIPAPYDRTVQFPESGLERIGTAAGASLPPVTKKNFMGPKNVPEMESQLNNIPSAKDQLKGMWNFAADPIKRAQEGDFAGALGEAGSKLLQSLVMKKAGDVAGKFSGPTTRQLPAEPAGVGLLKKVTEGGIAPTFGAALENFGENMSGPTLKSMARNPVGAIVKSVAGPAARGAGRMLQKDPFFMDRELNVTPGPGFQSAKGEYPYSLFSTDPMEPAPIHQKEAATLLLRKQGPRAAGWQKAGTEPTQNEATFSIDETPVPTGRKVKVNVPKSTMTGKQGFQDIKDDMAVKEEMQTHLGLSEEGAESLRKKEWYDRNKPGDTKTNLVKKVKAKSRGVSGSW